VTKRSKKNPNPAPSTRLAARLERIRDHYGMSLREFCLELGEKKEEKRDTVYWTADDREYSVSYGAVKTYHQGRAPSKKSGTSDRDAPAFYLARVAAVFDEFRLEWLVADEGMPTHAEQREAEAKAREQQGRYDLIREAVVDELGIRGTNAGVQWIRLAFFLAAHDTDVDEELGPDEAMAATVRRIAQALRAPLDSLGIDYRDVNELDTYLTLVGASLEGVFRSTAPKQQTTENAEGDDDGEA
jgi:hypothetical protein